MTHEALWTQQVPSLVLVKPTVEMYLPLAAVAAPPHNGPSPPRKGTMKGSSLSGGSRLTAAGGGEPGPLLGLPGECGVPPLPAVGLPPAGLHMVRR